MIIAGSCMNFGDRLETEMFFDAEIFEVLRTMLVEEGGQFCRQRFGIGARLEFYETPKEIAAGPVGHPIEDDLADEARSHGEEDICVQIRSTETFDDAGDL